jgi:hypothetical protein
VLYHHNNPTYNEQIIVRLPSPESLSKFHLYFEFRHCSSSLEKDESSDCFSFTYMPLITDKVGDLDVLIEDKVHVRPCFKYQYKFQPPLTSAGSLSHTFSPARPDLENEKSVSRGPSKSRVLTSDDPVAMFGPYFLKQSDEVFSFSTCVCSNRVSNDRTTSMINNWQNISPSDLKSMVNGLTSSVMTSKIVYFNIFFDNLLQMVSDKSTVSESISQIAFLALVRLMNTFGTSETEMSETKLMDYISNSSIPKNCHFQLLDLAT